MKQTISNRFGNSKCREAIWILSAWLLLSLSLSSLSNAALAATSEALNCSSNYQIVQVFDNGTRWEMCWEPRAGYGYRLSQVIYTGSDGVRRKVLETLHAAQLFVSYDDNRIRVHDVTFGLNLAKLTTADCPNGSLLTNSTLCLVSRPNGLGAKNLNTGFASSSNSFVLYGYYGIGAYFYTFQYKFFDDGSIEPALGASGNLQRFGGSASTGWPVKNQIAINHSHVVYWRMDFDVDGKSDNVVEQIDFNSDTPGSRSINVTPLRQETMQQNDLRKARFWRVRNMAQNNANGRNVSYEIEPNVTDVTRLGSEPFTQNDFYLTQFKSSENLVDDGAGLPSFVNGEVVTDPVVWYGVSFHHVPREEDDVRMPTHWQGFRIRPRDVSTSVRPTSNQAPTIGSPGAQNSIVGTAVNLTLLANDPDRDPVSLSASGLPPGLSINSENGLISGSPSRAGSYAVTVSVIDGRGGSAATNFTWLVKDAGVTRSFSNSGLITVRDRNSATPYPATINVNSMPGTIRSVSVQINGLKHTFPTDLDLLLVSPSGQKVLLLSDAGGSTPVSGLNLSFTAEGIAAPNSRALTTEPYRPTNYGTTADDFAAPAPVGPYSTDLSAFNGSSPNGNWQLYIMDDLAGDSGSISTGYSLTVNAQ